MKPFAEVIKTLGSKGVVVILPGELGLEITAGGQGLRSFDDLNRFDVSFDVGGGRQNISASLHRGSWCQCRRAWEGCSPSWPRVHPHGRGTRGSSCDQPLG